MDEEESGRRKQFYESGVSMWKQIGEAMARHGAPGVGAAVAGVGTHPTEPASALAPAAPTSIPTTNQQLLSADRRVTPATGVPESAMAPMYRPKQPTFSIPFDY